MSVLDITTWLYDEPTGLLTNKLYSDSHGPEYTYTPSGKLSRRTWARGIITDYAYDFAGALTNAVYNDETPAVAYTYNRLGQQLSAISPISTNIFVYSSTTLELDYELQNGLKSTAQPILSYATRAMLSLIQSNLLKRPHRVEFSDFFTRESPRKDKGISSPPLVPA
ncbi:MAG: hypothetical protein PHO37_17965 [Kiritimatiellae bacterium]|nr:hypothetical protein [Kiritimatiellia bacterium]